MLCTHKKLAPAQVQRQNTKNAKFTKNSKFWIKEAKKLIFSEIPGLRRKKNFEHSKDLEVQKIPKL
jgi:hypothetical protein